MDLYALFRFGHITGFVLLGGGLLAIFLSELRAYRTDDLSAFAEAARYTASFYDGYVIPGALLVALSGIALVFRLGLGFFEEPWLVAMWGLFLFEFVEGNTVTRAQFRRTLRRSREALARGGPLTDEIREQARGLVNRVTHFLDLPLFLVIIFAGAVRPDSWATMLVAVLLAVIAAASLTIAVPRLARR